MDLAGAVGELNRGGVGGAGVEVVVLLLLGAAPSPARARQARQDLLFRGVDVFDGSRMIRPAAVDVMNWVSIAIRTGRTKSSSVISVSGTPCRSSRPIGSGRA